MLFFKRQGMVLFVIFLGLRAIKLISIMTSADTRWLALNKSDLRFKQNIYRNFLFVPCS